MAGMSEKEVDKSLKELLDHGIVEETLPEHYRVTQSYREKFKVNFKEELEKKRSSDPCGVALTLSLAQIFYPDCFTKNEVTVLAIIHAKEMGLSSPNCVWCGEPLKLDPDKGWVHADGELYKKRPDGSDDHCALPDLRRG